MKNRTYCLLLFCMFTNTAMAGKFLPWLGADINGNPCNGTPRQGYGPYDYRLPQSKGNVQIVEDYHFSQNVEMLRHGDTGSIPGDLDYTLMAIPNHHKAILTAIRYQLKINQASVDRKFAHENGPLRTPVECYIQRAIGYVPEDEALYSLYGYYLHKLNKLNRAADFYKKALEINADSRKVKYMYALLLLDTKQYNEALGLAKDLYQHKDTPNGLKNKMVKLGVWK